MATLRCTCKTTADHRTLDRECPRHGEARELELRSQAWSIERGCYPEAELDRLADAGRAQIEAERVVFARVNVARQAGASWDQIGSALGVSRQAAHKRFTVASDRV